MKTEVRVITKFPERNSSIWSSVIPPLHTPLPPPEVHKSAAISLRVQKVSGSDPDTSCLESFCCLPQSLKISVRYLNHDRSLSHVSSSLFNNYPIIRHTEIVGIRAGRSGVRMPAGTRN